MDSINIVNTYDQLIAVPMMSAGIDTSTDFNKYELTNGAGQLTKAGASISGGVSGVLKIDVNVKTVTEETLKKFQQTVTHTLTEEQARELETMRQSGGYAKWFLGLFGIASNQNAHTYEKSKNTNTTITKDEINESLQTLINQEQKECKVKGRFTISSSSFVPTEVSLYVQMLIIKTSSGQTLKVLNNQVIPADKSGNRENLKVEGDNRLNIIDL